MTDLYRYTPEFLQGRQADLQGALNGTDLLPVMCRSVAARVRGSKLAYLEFGPYWWAVKRILNANGFELGPTDNPYVAERFNEATPELTLIAAWEAADWNRDEYFAGTRDFPLDDLSEEVVSLFDPDMES